MMDYEVFKEIVIEKFEDFLPNDLKDYEMSVRTDIKVNRTVDSVNIIPKNKDGVVEMSTFYINDLYEKYLAGYDLQEILEKAAKDISKSFNENEKIDIATIKDNIIVTLVNTEQNKKLLQDVPSREFQDLSIIYRWVIEQKEDGISSTIVGNKLAEKIGLNEEMLYIVAMKNTERLFPTVIKSMEDVVKEMMLRDGIPKELVEIIVEEVPEEKKMYIFSNNIGIQGAASMLYEDKLYGLAEKINNNLYIMPSSIHEVIAVSAKIGKPEYLAEIVNEVNLKEVAIEERLSNQVYLYDKDIRKISLATNTPNKSLYEDNQRNNNKKGYTR